MILTNRERAREWVCGLKIGEVVTFEKSGNFYAVRVVGKARDGGAIIVRACDYNEFNGVYRVKRGAGREFWTIGDLVGAEI